MTRHQLSYLPFIALMAAISCAPQKNHTADLPNIMDHALADPSGLATNGQKLFIADWKSAGILIIDLVSGKLDHLATTPEISTPKNALRPLQAIPLDSEKILLENYDGSLWIFAAAWKPLRGPDHRATASPLCWDGLRVHWLDGQYRAQAAILEDGSMVNLPEQEETLGNILQESDSIMSWSCSWNEFFTLAKKGSDYFICHESAHREQNCAAWTDPQFYPIALTQTNRQGAIILARHRRLTGSYQLFPWPAQGKNHV